VRLALIPVFLVLSLSSDTGTDALPAIIFAVVAWSDYADGIAARVTGQYSRFGALLDPIVDRLLIISGVVACWYHDLLPRWALAVLVLREAFMLAAGRDALVCSRTVCIARSTPMDTFPDLGSLTDEELKDLINQLTEKETAISYERRILHGQIDILRAELVNRLRKKHETGEDVITDADV